MYIVVNKKNGWYIKDTGTSSNEEGIRENLEDDIHKYTQQIVHVKDSSPLTKVIHIMVESDCSFKILHENGKAVGIRL